MSFGTSSFSRVFGTYKMLFSINDRKGTCTGRETASKPRGNCKSSDTPPTRFGRGGTFCELFSFECVLVCLSIFKNGSYGAKKGTILRVRVDKLSKCALGRRVFRGFFVPMGVIFNLDRNSACISCKTVSKPKGNSESSDTPPTRCGRGGTFCGPFIN
jgi:hypothetical protein